MKKNIVLLAALVILSFAVSAQEKSVNNKAGVSQAELHLKNGNEVKGNPTKVDNNDIYTALKPADGRPAVFNSKEQLESSVPGKRNNALLLIKTKNLEGDTERVKILRWELWRLENAIIVEPKNKN